MAELAIAESRPIREPAVLTNVWEGAAYGGLLLFFLFLYSSLAVIHPSLSPIQPAKWLGMVTIGFLVVGRVASGRSWDTGGLQSVFVLGLLGLGGAAIYSALWPALALQGFFDLFKMVAIYFAIINLVDRPKRARGVIWVMLLAGLIPAIGSIHQYQAGVDLAQGRSAWVGLFEDPNELSYSLVILIPFAFALFEHYPGTLVRVVLVAVVAVFLVAIATTQSRGGFLGVVAVFGLAVLLNRHRVSLAVLAILLLGSMVLAMPDQFGNRLAEVANFRSDDSIMGRIYAWGVGLQIVMERPFTGVGINCFPLAWPLYAPIEAGHQWRTAHNAFIQVAGEVGVAGLPIFVGMIGLAMSRLWARMRVDKGPTDARILSKGIWISLGGYVTCAMALSIAFNWFLFILLGLTAAVTRPREGQGGTA